MAKAEGRQFNFESTAKIDSSLLECFEFKSIDQYIKVETQEFNAVCPFSGLPDIAQLVIEYYPAGESCLELKSLKYYLITFRNVGIYQEAVTRRIYDDLRTVLNTKRIKITTKYNTRGGFDTTCVEGGV